MLKIRILAENLVQQRNLLAEHGLSLWIEDGTEHILFDVGQTDVYLRNAKALGIDLSQARAIVISHGHFDHGGGLVYFPHGDRWPSVFIHPDAFLPKLERSRNPETPHQAIGFPWQKDSLLGPGSRLMLNTSTMQIGQRLFACTAIPRVTDFETLADHLLVEKDCQLAIDDMHDEQMLVCLCEQGLVVILGCSHPGVINCLKHAQALFPGRPIHTLMGGMHLEKVSQDRLLRTFAFFEQMEIAQMIPLHCTGQNVIWQLRQHFGERVQTKCTGDEVRID